MEPFVRHTGLVAPLDRVDVDTDQIIPKQFLKRIERTGFGQFLFYDWRLDEHTKEVGRSGRRPSTLMTLLPCSGSSRICQRRSTM